MAGAPAGKSQKQLVSCSSHLLAQALLLSNREATSPQFVAFVEQKLQENGVAMVVPDHDLLVEAYSGFERSGRLEKAIEQFQADSHDDHDVTAPDNLAEQVAELLERNPIWRWDRAVQAVASDADSAQPIQESP
jgi:hypothetical protein